MKNFHLNIMFTAIAFFGLSCASAESPFSKNSINQPVENLEFVETDQTRRLINYTCVELVQKTIQAYNQFVDSEGAGGAVVGEGISVASFDCTSEPLGVEASIYLYFTSSDLDNAAIQTGPGIYAKTENGAETFEWSIWGYGSP